MCKRSVSRLPFIAAGLALWLASAAAPMALAQTAQDIIAASDKVRNPGQPFRSTDTLTEFIAGKPRDQNILLVFAKEDPETRQFRNLIRYLEPPRDQGKMVLLDGRVLWFYDPSSKASVRISAQQRLIGQASIADVLTVNFAIDYTGKLLGDETIQDAARQNRICWHLDMKAANDQSTYNRVEYWVEHTTNYPIKAKFYSDSGRLLKILYYRNFAERLGAVRPTEAVIIDAVDSSLVTTVAFGDYRPQEIPEAWFQREYLPRLRAE
jgi:hypothetical protein